MNPGQWGWRFPSLQAACQEAERCGFGAVACFDHVATAPRGLAAWDAPSVLTAIVGIPARLRSAWVAVRAHDAL